MLIAAAFHATWNALLKLSTDPLPAAALAAVVSSLVWAPVVAVVWLADGRPAVPPEGWALASISACLELAYFVFLSAAYRRGELSSVYALARGSAPLLAVLAGLLLLHERLGVLQMVGIACLLAGLWLVQRPRPAGAATLSALLTGAAIASYSTVDSVGVHTAAPWLYGYVVWVLTAVLLVIFTRAKNSSPVAPSLTGLRSLRIASRAGLVGMLMTSTYLLILFAYRLAPLAVVAPLRESSIVLVALWAAWKLHERELLWVRLLGAGAVALGASLIAAG